jgi:hypothetical protein
MRQINKCNGLIAPMAVDHTEEHQASGRIPRPTSCRAALSALRRVTPVTVIRLTPGVLERRLGPSLTGKDGDMSATPRDPSAPPQRDRRDWTKNLVIPVLVAVLGGLLLVVFTPAGTWARELFFPTKAAVTGTVEMDGAPVPKAAVRLDDDDKTVATDTAGRFQLTDVRRGKHTLHVAANGARDRDFDFSVQAAANSADVGVVKVDAYLRLGYFASVRMPLEPSGNPKVKYDVTLWLTGEDDAMESVRRAAYVMPAPLPADQVAGADRSRSFCYRVKGSVPFQDLMVLGGAFAGASGTVELADAKSVTVSAVAPKPGQPVPCKAHKGSELEDEVDRSHLPGGGNPDNPGNPGGGNTGGGNTDTPKVEVPDVAGLSESQATGRLIRALLVPETQTRSSDTVPKESVIGTDPEAGSRVERGGTITVLVSSGPEGGTGATVPDVIGDDVNAATNLLKSMGFGAASTAVKSDQPPGTVLSQDPAGGTRAEPGRTITLTHAGG